LVDVTKITLCWYVSDVDMGIVLALDLHLVLKLNHQLNSIALHCQHQPYHRIDVDSSTQSHQDGCHLSLRRL
jgi:hypothetical protein